MDDLGRSPSSNSDSTETPHLHQDEIQWAPHSLGLQAAEWNGNNMEEHPGVHKDEDDNNDSNDDEDDNSSLMLLDYQEEVIETEEVSTLITDPGEMEFLDMSPADIQNIHNGDEFVDQDSDESLMGLAIKPIIAEVQVDTENADSTLQCPVRRRRDENSENSRNPSAPKLYARKHPAIPMNIWAKDPLPDGWKLIHHNSGMPMYVQKETNVITFSRPYVFNRSAPIKAHQIPLASIPCMEYAKIQDKLENDDNNATVAHKKRKTETDGEERNGVKDGDDSNEAVSLKPVFHDSKVVHIETSELEEYLGKRFKFNTVFQPRFNTWGEHRKYSKTKRKRKHNNNNNSASNNKDGGGADDENSNNHNHDEEAATPSITNGGRKKKPGEEVQSNVINMLIRKEHTKDGKPRNLSFNVQTKSPICILHEYCQNALKAKPEYKFLRKESNTDPFRATVLIEGKEYATASAINKKAAKNLSALESMEVLAPGFKLNYEKALGNQSNDFLSNLDILDDRVSDFCLKSGGYFPERLLQECINRNKGVSDIQSDFYTKMGKNNAIQYTLKYGRHHVTGTAKNKRMARQESAQRMLARLHPEMKKWGEVIHKYGVTVSEKKNQRRTEEQEIFELKQRDRDARLKQSADRMAPTYQPDTWERREAQEEAEASGVVEKLKKVMLNLRTERLAEEERRAKAVESGSGVSKLCARCHTWMSSIDPQDIPPTKRMLLGGVNL